MRLWRQTAAAFQMHHARALCKPVAAQTWHGSQREAHLSERLFSNVSLRPAAMHIYRKRLNFGNGVTLISEI